MTLALLLLLGCPSWSPSPDPPPRPQPGPGPALEEEEEPEGGERSECVAECMAQEMARAEPVESIEADCRNRCGESLPLVRAVDDLELRLGQRVRVEGELLPGDPVRVALEGGSVPTDIPAEVAEPHRGRPVRVECTWTTRPGPPGAPDATALAGCAEPAPRERSAPL